MVLGKMNSNTISKFKKLPKVLGVSLTCGICALGVYGAVAAFNSTGANNENFNTQDNSITQSVNTENSNTPTDTKAFNEYKSKCNQDNIFSSISNFVNSFVNPTNEVSENTNEASAVNNNSNSNNTNEQTTENIENSVVFPVANNSSDKTVSEDPEPECPGNLVISGGVQGKDEDWHFDDRGDDTYYIHPVSADTVISVWNKDEKNPTCSQLYIDNTYSNHSKDVNIKLCNVNLESSTPIEVDEDCQEGNISVILADNSDNKLKATSDYDSGLEKKDDDATLIIKAESDNKEKWGKLSAWGNKSAAGIGTGNGEGFSSDDVNNLLIESGIIFAYGDAESAAGIGNGDSIKTIDGDVNNLKITGGEIHVSGRVGIGTNSGGFNNAEITGGSIDCNGSHIGIGCGEEHGSMHSIKIHNVNIVNCEGIRGGEEQDTTNIDIENCTIVSSGPIGSGYNSHITKLKIINSDITASSSDDGYAAIGSGERGSVDNIIIDNSSIKAKSSTDGAAIGCGGGCGNDHTSVKSIKITNSKIVAESKSGGAIGAGKFGFVHGVYLDNSIITASTEDKDAAAIGSGDKGGTDKNAIIIEGGSIKTKAAIDFEGGAYDKYGNCLKLFTVDNRLKEKVSIQNSLRRDQEPVDWKIYNHDPDNTDHPDYNLYTYQPVAMNSLSRVVSGVNTYEYWWNGSSWVNLKDAPLLEGDLSINGADPFKGDYRYDSSDNHYCIHPTGGKDQVIEIKNKDISKASGCEVTVDSFDGAVANVKLSGVNIQSYNPIKIADNNPGDVKIILADDSTNTLTCINDGDEDYAALQKNTSPRNDKVGKLLITGEKKGNGKLNATGQWDGAGIGSAEYYDARNIEITGGDITAASGDGASIGSGQGGSVYNFVISGGKINAQKTLKDSDESADGAGIGSGSATKDHNNDVYGLTISDGDIEAVGYHGASIGSGSDGDLYNLEITGGKINAVKSFSDRHHTPNGSGIGSGDNGEIYGNGNNHGILIKGGHVQAESYDGAAIGTGKDGDINDTGIEISDGIVITSHKSTDKATDATGAGIGTGNNGDICGGATVKISGGAISATSSNCNANCIGTGKSGSFSDEGKLVITGGSLVTHLDDGGKNWDKSPVDSYGNAVYPIDIDNPDDCEIYVNDKNKYNGTNHKGINPSDPYLHGYLPNVYGGKITITLKHGDTVTATYKYELKNGFWQGPKNSDNLQKSQNYQSQLNKNDNQKQEVGSSNLLDKRNNYASDMFVEKYEALKQN